MFKFIKNNVFSVNINYFYGYIKFFIRIFGLKLSFKIVDKKVHFKGKNNKLYIKQNKILKESKKIVPGLSIDIDGENNIIIIDSECKFCNSIICCNGNNNEIIIEKSVYNISNLTVNFSGKLDNRKVHIKENVSIGGAKLNCWSENSKITIGQDCMLSYGIKIINGDGHILLDKLTNEYLKNNHNIYCEIGNHVWIGLNSIICKNVKIPDNCVIGAGSVVTKSFNEENCAIAGNPAKIIKKNINWDRKEKI